MNLDAQLSRRELEVAECLAFTKCKTEAADKLCIAEGTLAAHSCNIYDKLGINTKSELVIWWFVKNLKIPVEKIPQFVVGILISLGTFSTETKTCRRLPQRIENQPTYTTSK